MEIPLGVIALCIAAYYVLRYIWELIPVDNLSRKAVFISGCDTGFGRALALRCARAGLTVFAGCYTTEGATSLTAEAKGKLVITVPLDVTKDESVQEARKFVIENMPKGVRLWAVVCNAGVFSVYGPDDWTSVEDYRTSIEVNTFGVIRCVQTFMDLIKDSEGRVIAMSSVAGRTSIPFGAPYAVAKYGVEAYMDALRMETHFHNVKCSIIEPGIFKTSILDENAMNARVDKVWSRLSERTKEEWGEKYKDEFKSNWSDTCHSIGSTNIDWVIESYFHAISAKYPRNRYACGYDAVFFWLPMSFLDSHLVDAFRRYVAGSGTYPAAVEKKLKAAEVARISRIDRLFEMTEALANKIQTYLN